MNRTAIRDFRLRTHRVEVDLLCERARWTMLRARLQSRGAWLEALRVSPSREDAAALLSARLHGAGLGEADANGAHGAWVHMMVGTGILHAPHIQIAGYGLEAK